MKNVTLANVKDFAFLANKAYASEAEIKNEQQSNKDIGNNYAVYNPATNSSFEVIDQKRDNNGFATMLVKNIDNNNANNIKYVIVYRGTDGINDISTNPTTLLDMRRLLLTHTLELRLSLYGDFALHLCGLSFLCHR